jgi:hypothetical protein
MEFQTPLSPPHGFDFQLQKFFGCDINSHRQKHKEVKVGAFLMPAGG